MITKMTTHALLIWLGFVALAVLNGAFRQRFLVPWLGEESGHVVSSVILCAAIVLVTWITLPWVGPTMSRDAWRLGALWLAMTLAFEFLAGHYLFHSPWAKLLADYNLARGRIWVFVLITTFSAPILAFRFRR